MKSPGSARDVGGGRLEELLTLVLNLMGTFAFGLSGGILAVKKRMDLLRRPRAQCVDWSRRGNRERSDSRTYAAGNPDRLALSWHGRFSWGPSLRLVQ